MYLVIDSALLEDRHGNRIFIQQVCDLQHTFNNHTFIGKKLLQRHTSKAFHHRNLYQGTVLKKVVFGIINPETDIKLSVGIVVDSAFDFDKHIPRL